MAAGPSKELYMKDAESNTVGAFLTNEPQERQMTVMFYIDEKKKKETKLKKVVTPATDEPQGYIDEPDMKDTACGTVAPNADKPQKGQTDTSYWIDGPEMKDMACGTTETLAPNELQDITKTVIHFIDEKVIKNGSGSVNVFTADKTTQCGKWLALKRAVEKDRKLRNKVMRHVEDNLPNGGKENQGQLTPDQELALVETRDALTSFHVADLALKFQRLNHCKWKL